MPPVSAQDGVAPRSQQGLLAVPGQESTVKDRKHSMSRYARDSTPDSFPSEFGHPRLHRITSFPCKLQVEKTPPHKEGGAVLVSA